MAMYRCGSNSGGGVTPTSITPSNATPAAMSLGGIYETTAAGYAIASYDSKTPDDTTPPTVASGDIVKMGGAGYLYSTIQQGVNGYSLLDDQVTTGATAHTLSNMKGKKLLILLFYWQSSTNLSVTRFDGATASGGTVTKVANLLSENARTAGTFYFLNVTSNSCTITAPYSCYMKTFGTT